MSWYRRHGGWVHGGLALAGAALLVLGVLRESVLDALLGAVVAVSQALELRGRREREPDAGTRAAPASRRLGAGLVVAGLALVAAVAVVALLS